MDLIDLTRYLAYPVMGSVCDIRNLFKSFCHFFQPANELPPPLPCSAGRSEESNLFGFLTEINEVAEQLRKISRWSWMGSSKRNLAAEMNGYRTYFYDIPTLKKYRVNLHAVMKCAIGAG